MNHDSVNVNLYYEFLLSLDKNKMPSLINNMIAYYNNYDDTVKFKQQVSTDYLITNIDIDKDGLTTYINSNIQLGLEYSYSHIVSFITIKSLYNISNTYIYPDIDPLHFLINRYQGYEFLDTLISYTLLYMLHVTSVIIYPSHNSYNDTLFSQYNDTSVPSKEIILSKYLQDNYGKNSYLMYNPFISLFSFVIDDLLYIDSNNTLLKNNDIRDIDSFILENNYHPIHIPTLLLSKPLIISTDDNNSILLPSYNIYPNLVPVLNDYYAYTIKDPDSADMPKLLDNVFSNTVFSKENKYAHKQIIADKISTLNNNDVKSKLFSLSDNNISNMHMTYINWIDTFMHDNNLPKFSDIIGANSSVMVKTITKYMVRNEKMLSTKLLDNVLDYNVSGYLDSLLLIYLIFKNRLQTLQLNRKQYYRLRTTEEFTVIYNTYKVLIHFSLAIHILDALDIRASDLTYKQFLTITNTNMKNITSPLLESLISCNIIVYLYTDKMSVNDTGIIAMKLLFKLLFPVKQKYIINNWKSANISAVITPLVLTNYPTVKTYYRKLFRNIATKYNKLDIQHKVISKPYDIRLNKHTSSEYKILIQNPYINISSMFINVLRLPEKLISSYISYLFYSDNTKSSPYTMFSKSANITKTYDKPQPTYNTTKLFSIRHTIKKFKKLDTVRNKGVGNTKIYSITAEKDQTSAVIYGTFEPFIQLENGVYMQISIMPYYYAITLTSEAGTGTKHSIIKEPIFIANNKRPIGNHLLTHPFISYAKFLAVNDNRRRDYLQFTFCLGSYTDIMRPLLLSYNITSAIYEVNKALKYYSITSSPYRHPYGIDKLSFKEHYAITKTFQTIISS